MNRKHQGLKVQVKSGSISTVEALTKCSPESHTYGWLQRRFARENMTRAQKAGAK